MKQYTVDYDKEDLIEIAIKEWVLAWCKKHNPEVFDRAKGFIVNQMEKNDSRK